MLRRATSALHAAPPKGMYKDYRGKQGVVTKSTGLGNKRYDYSPGLTRLFFQTRARGFVAPRLQRYPSATVITLLAVWVIVPTQSPPVPRLGDELPSGTPPLRATPKFCGLLLDLN